jgi:hypothetical protein
VYTCEKLGLKLVHMHEQNKPCVVARRSEVLIRYTNTAINLLQRNVTKTYGVTNTNGMHSIVAITGLVNW